MKKIRYKFSLLKEITQKGSGFTIVELLVVIVVIGILASIAMVSYSGITLKATSAVLQSDLRNASTILEMDKAKNGVYPDTEAEANDGKGLPKSASTEYQYTVQNGEYYLSATTSKTNEVAYYTSSTTSGYVADGVWSGHVAPGGGTVDTTSWSQLSLNNQPQSCAITAGKAYCWGAGANDSTTDSSIPFAVNTSGVLGGKTITAISQGSSFICAVASGQAYCWGTNWAGQLGNNSTTDSSTPVAVNTSVALSGKTVTAISAGSDFACAIASGQAYCWGHNGYGQLGNNSATDSSIPVPVDTTGVLAGKTITAISTGKNFTCAIADSQAYCWGGNSDGQLGTWAANERIPLAVDTSGVLGGKAVTAISTGSAHTCAVASGQAYCWGRNANGQLGNNSTTTIDVPVAVSTADALSGKTVTAISTATYNTCAVASGKAYCWGYNYYGQLGNNSTADSLIPVAVDTSNMLSGKTVTAISSGYSHSCVIADDQVYCWGSNTYGELGNSSTTSSYVPVAISSI